MIVLVGRACGSQEASEVRIPIFLASTAALCLTGSAHAQISGCSQEETIFKRAVLESVIDCVQNNARALERSRETPENVATAAVSMCGKGIVYLRRTCGGDSLADVAERELPSLAIAKVLKIRAKRPAR